jgi:hypothetical protein
MTLPRWALGGAGLGGGWATRLAADVLAAQSLHFVTRHAVAVADLKRLRVTSSHHPPERRVWDAQFSSRPRQRDQFLVLHPRRIWIPISRIPQSVLQLLTGYGRIEIQIAVGGTA